MIYFDNPTQQLRVTLTVDATETSGSGKISLYNSNQPESPSIALNSGINIVKLGKASGVKSLVLEHNSQDRALTDTLYIQSIRVTNGFNPALVNPHITLTGSQSVLSTIRSLATVNNQDMFNYLNVPDNSKAMDTATILTPNAF